MTHIDNRNAVPLPPGAPAVVTLTGLVAIALAIYQVASPDPPEASYESVGDYFREFGFLAYLLGSIASVAIAARAGIAARPAFVLVACGYAALAVGVTAGLVLREDPEWFFVLGGPGNLAAAAGFVVLAVSGWRRHVLPGRAALLCGVGGIVAVLMSELGTSVLIGAFWLYVASTMRAARVVTPAI